MHESHVRSSVDPQILERARLAAAEIAPWAHEIEAGRRLPPAVVDALVRAGVFKLLVPRAYGGAETSLATFVAVIDEIARADGSAGWCAMIGASSGLMAGFLSDAVARTVYGPDDASTCGVAAPLGKAVPVAGGFRVSGRWAFGSGCQHSTWCMGGTLIDGEVLPGGAPDVRCMLFHVSEIRILDTWDTSGLRGTGSHDFVAEDVFVPAERSFSLLSGRHALPAYRSAFFGGLAAGVAAVTLGIARAAIDAFTALARDKRPMGTRQTLAHRELAQLAVARAEARVRAARSFLLEALDAASAAGAPGQATADATVEQRALLRLAACHAASEAAAAIDLVYEAGGASSFHATSPLQRCFRDVHTATQHAMVSPTTAARVGRVLLGIEPDTSNL